MSFHTSSVEGRIGAKGHECALARVRDPINEVRGWLAASHGQAGNAEQARRYLDAFPDHAETDMVRFPGHRLRDWEPYWMAAIKFRNRNDLEHPLDGLREGRPAGVSGAGAGAASSGSPQPPPASSSFRPMVKLALPLMWSSGWAALWRCCWIWVLTLRLVRRQVLAITAFKSAHSSRPRR